jgi:hypothetical protein
MRSWDIAAKAKIYPKQGIAVLSKAFYLCPKIKESV